ncbi:MAG: response regulator transcription factor [Anaerolineaceae bacterium]|nr:response regulator transcription factor [Anaerolineaceae bacterium]
MPNAKILVVDDEPSILKLVTAYLQSEGYDFMTAEDGISALKAVRSYHPDIIILDIMLPGMDGIEVLGQLRRESNAYVIMLTARSEETDKIIGLSVGADDYLTKPFSPRELMARIKAILRRMRTASPQDNQSVIALEHIRIDNGRRRVWVDDQEIELTTLEFNLLNTLASHPGMVFSRERLLEKVWGYDYFGDLRVVDVHIGHLRQKIGKDYIETVHGTGYRFQER